MSDFKFNFFDQEDKLETAPNKPELNYSNDVIEIRGDSVLHSPTFTTNILTQTIREHNFRICTSPSKLNLQEFAKFFNSTHCPIKSMPQLGMWLSGASDVIPGIYEGGFKLWEGSIDLLSYLIHNNINFSNQLVLDLGCGVGLLGILALQKGAKVLFQDCNLDVLQCSTIPHCSLNKTCLDQSVFVSGAWEMVNEYFLTNKSSFDIILSSETIYNKASYPILCEMLHQTLKPNGIAYIAAKQTYFGLSGSIHLFREFVYKFGSLECSIIDNIEVASPRQILAIRKL